ncbi:MAG: radical SAM protein with 4Fe4S-binding SPASM domain [Sulfurimonas sp.]|jgi:radical SAM protein with 4Fe4S-binding SPASM domain|uniref:radical SAM/SPASM domain-containing protein n=1 Tax=Sulfurimonas sp. TaxID=2022749 RepID=UPI0039E59735
MAKKSFNRVHIEVTNICGLACSFCPPKLQPNKTMSLPFFNKVITDVSNFTNELAFHVMGDPLTLSNLEKYLESSHQLGLKVILTSSGYYLNRTSFKTLFHPSVKQVNISLNSFNKNSLNLTFDDYMKEVFSMCEYKLQNHPHPFINLRLWNFDETCSEKSFNEDLFSRLSSHFGVELDIGKLFLERPKSIRLASKVLLHFDSYFEWPSMSSTHDTQGSCYGLKSHIGVLADGTVVPCCLDGDGVINLGNLHEESLGKVLNSKRAVTMRIGFDKGEAVEEMCKKCSYKDRFSL